jgi:hypothetical protein
MPNAREHAVESDLPPGLAKPALRALAERGKSFA